MFVCLFVGLFVSLDYETIHPRNSVEKLVVCEKDELVFVSREVSGVEEVGPIVL